MLQTRREKKTEKSFATLVKLILTPRYKYEALLDSRTSNNFLMKYAPADKIEIVNLPIGIKIPNYIIKRNTHMCYPKESRRDMLPPA